MALNTYTCEERIDFGDEPSINYGFYLSDSSYSTSVVPFESAESRQGFIDAVKAILGEKFEWRAPACLALLYAGDSDKGDDEWAQELLRDKCELELNDADQVDQIEVAYGKYTGNY